VEAVAKPWNQLLLLLWLLPITPSCWSCLCRLSAAGQSDLVMAPAEPLQA